MPSTALLHSSLHIGSILYHPNLPFAIAPFIEVDICPNHPITSTRSPGWVFTRRHHSQHQIDSPLTTPKLWIHVVVDVELGSTIAFKILGCKSLSSPTLSDKQGSRPSRDMTCPDCKIPMGQSLPLGIAHRGQITPASSPVQPRSPHQSF